MPDAAPLPPVARVLAAQSVPHRVFRHPGPVHSLEQAARERGLLPEQVIRSIVFRAAEGNYVMVLVAGARQVAWRALRRYLGQSRLTTATEAELLEATGYAAGAVAPFGLPRPMRVLLDESVLAQPEISIGSGERGVTIILASDDLRAALPASEVGIFAEDDVGTRGE
ncbi:MAG: YbaK/EbsC family protein [Anaerolineales bacterium]|nr:YbaK/EbsC family protein [Anaerolineales bacterium]